MNERNDIDPIDDEVRAAYRDASSRLRTPAGLDRAVLEAARDAGPKRFAPAWTRPLAFAATLVLGVTLLFEMQGQQELAPVSGERSPQREAVTPASTESADETRGSMPAAKPAMPAVPPADGAVELPSMERQRLDPDDAASSDTSFSDAALLPGVSAPQPRLQRGAARSANEAAESLATGLAADEPVLKREDGESAPQCTAAQRLEPESWQACIDALENAGHRDAASDERRRLSTRFPEFTAPE